MNLIGSFWVDITLVLAAQGVKPMSLWWVKGVVALKPYHPTSKLKWGVRHMGHYPC
jgi:hypothetical protein